MVHKRALPFGVRLARIPPERVAAPGFHQQLEGTEGVHRQVAHAPPARGRGRHQRRPGSLRQKLDPVIQYRDGIPPQTHAVHAGLGSREVQQRGDLRRVHYGERPATDQQRGDHRGPGLHIPALTLSSIDRVHRLELDFGPAKELPGRGARSSPGPPEKNHLGHTLLRLSQPTHSEPIIRSDLTRLRLIL